MNQVKNFLLDTRSEETRRRSRKEFKSVFFVRRHKNKKRSKEQKEMVNAKSESIKVQIFLCGINLKKSLKAFWQTYTAQKKEKRIFKFIQTTLKDENCFYFCALIFFFEDR